MIQEWFRSALSRVCKALWVPWLSSIIVNNCVFPLVLQENLIGALLAIFGHLVSSIALNLQVSALKQILMLHSNKQSNVTALLCFCALA